MNTTKSDPHKINHLITSSIICVKHNSKRFSILINNLIFGLFSKNQRFLIFKVFMLIISQLIGPGRFLISQVFRDFRQFSPFLVVCSISTNRPRRRQCSTFGASQSQCLISINPRHWLATNESGTWTSSRSISRYYRPFAIFRLYQTQGRSILRKQI